MPTYVVTSTCGRLNQEQKNRIAEDITHIHCEETGAPKYFVQIIFNEVDRDNYYLGGKTLKEDNIYIHAHIRQGRTLASKQIIIETILSRVSETANADPSAVQTYIMDIPASQVAEFGAILPEPGQEKIWEKNQTKQAKERMLRLS